MDALRETRCHVGASLPATEEERLFLENVDLVFTVAVTHRGRFATEDDFQNGAIGLLEAIRTHDPAKASLRTHAVRRIFYAISHGWRERNALASTRKRFTRQSRKLEQYASRMEKEEDWFTAWAALRVLDKRDLALLCSYYLEDLNIKELGVRYHCSRQAIHQHIQRAMKDVQTIARALIGDP